MKTEIENSDDGLFRLYKATCRACGRVTLQAIEGYDMIISHNMDCSESELDEVNLIFDPIHTGLWPIEVHRLE